MPVPKPHRSPKAAVETPWDWNAAKHTNEILEHGGWNAMARAHAWYDQGAQTTTIPRARRVRTSFPTTKCWAGS